MKGSIRIIHPLPILVIILLLIQTACSHGRVSSTGNIEKKGEYAGEFSSSGFCPDPELIIRSVKKIYSVSSYTTYQFRRESRITAYSLRLGTFHKAAWGVISTNETVFGTATVIGASNSRVALLTCAHVVTSPDTVVTYFETADDDPIHYIQTISIKEKQENWVKDLALCGSFQVLASNLSADIAILGRNCERNTDTLAAVPFVVGNAGDLEWGDFVYILGYPMGNLILTRGIASLAAKRPMGEFSVDALLNKGCSGGVILARCNKKAGFELVGMVKTVSSTREEFLKPAPNMAHLPDWLPYKGDIFPSGADYLQYGLNSVVPVETIREFYQANRSDLLGRGYELDEFFLSTGL